MTLDEFKKCKLPDEPGVYRFLDSKKHILYIGKATSLCDRVRSYFANDLMHTRGKHIVDMVTLARNVAFTITDSVLEAIILEAALIKDHQPLYNTKEKDNKSFNYAVITNEEFPRVFSIRERTMLSGGEEINKKYKYIFGPFPQGTNLVEALKLIRGIFPYRDKCTPYNVEPQQIDEIQSAGNEARKAYSDMLTELQGEALPVGTHSDGGNIVRAFEIYSEKSKSYTVPVGKPNEEVRHLQRFRPCFDRQIGLCPGVCTGEITARDYAKTIQHIKLFFEGKKSVVLRQLKREMHAHAKKLEFELAHESKKAIFALTHIKDASLIREEIREVSQRSSKKRARAYRIEAYDIAHISGKYTVGVMVVVEDGRPKNSDYRKFKIRIASEHADDTLHLEEVLMRRFTHAEWQKPDLLVIDGGIAQKRRAEGVIKKLLLEIPVVSVVKDARHKPKAILGNRELAESYKHGILIANAESHRFAVAYHRTLRDRLRPNTISK